MTAIKIFIGGTIWTLVNLVYGLCFLFRHPIQFMKFVEHYRGFSEQIDQHDAIIASGFYHYPRRIRRALTRRLKQKTMDV